MRFALAFILIALFKLTLTSLGIAILLMCWKISDQIEEHKCNKN